MDNDVGALTFHTLFVQFYWNHAFRCLASPFFFLARKIFLPRHVVCFYCCPVKLKIAQNLSPNSFIIKDSDFFMIKASPPN